MRMFLVKDRLGDRYRLSKDFSFSVQHGEKQVFSVCHLFIFQENILHWELVIMSFLFVFVEN